jgi:hypothetical protein
MVERLSVNIGPRPSASAQEEEAARYLDNFFRERGLESRVISFRSVRTFSLTYAVYYTVSIAAVLLFTRWPAAAVLLASANLLFFVAEINTFHIIGALLARWRSHNTVARLAAASTVKRTVIFSAHLDSSRSGVLFSPPLVSMFRYIFVSGLVSFVLIPCLLATGLIFGHPVFWAFSLFPALSLLAGILLLLQRELFGNYTAGANDNASAVAVLGGLADYFAKNPADNCELYFVGTGSEESGIIGMTHFLKNSRNKLLNPLFINLESLGCGQLKYIEREGMFPALRADPYLRNLAEKAAKNRRLPFVAGRFHTILTDNVSVLARRLPGLTLMGCGPDQLIPYWHQSGDIFHNIREENLIQAVELVKEMVTLIDTENFETH